VGPGPGPATDLRRMQNPLRSETDAFHLLLYVLGVAVVVVIVVLVVQAI
jgi:hypothetical protein